jgi:hypothetical protein
LPPELLRKGRFDEIFFSTCPPLRSEKRYSRSISRSRRLDPPSSTCDYASAGYSEAEIEEAIIARDVRHFYESSR